MLGKVTWFAKNIGIPWIPVTPTFPWFGPAGLLPLPSKWFVQFGEPIDLAAQHGPEAADDRLLRPAAIRSGLDPRSDRCRGAADRRDH